ncbi:MAG: kynureninase [Planctomycetota bacterium]
MSFEIPSDVQLDPAFCASLDEQDPLASLRHEFMLPDGVIYLDGMSLGALPKKTSQCVSDVVNEQWGQGLIRSWNSAGWMEAPQRIGGKIARLINAHSDEVVIADSTSVNLFKLLVGALDLKPERRTVLIESTNFPTDIYIAKGVSQLLPGIDVRVISVDQLSESLDDSVAVVMMTHVDYKSSQLQDMEGITRLVHNAGALMLWDLSHSTGAVPLDLARSRVDFAVGCGYKYLNGGPGAPAFVFVALRHLQNFKQPITAWMGHARPFDFTIDYEPSPNISRMLSGTPMILSLAALEVGVDLWAKIDPTLARAKSVALSKLFLSILERTLDTGCLKVASPRDPSQRGGHIAIRHEQGYAVMQAMIDRGVIGDFREPDLMRFGFAPLYLRFIDIWNAAQILTKVIQTNAWDSPEYRERAAVT